MRIVVTGASGFIGSHLMPILAAQGHDAIGVGRTAVMPDHVDVCLHLAWRGYAGSGGADENLASVNFGITMLRLLQHSGCRRFVGVGSCFEYEPSRFTLSERNALADSGPNPFYSRCKALYRDLAAAFCESAGVSFAWARIFNCYGPGEHADRLVPALLRAARTGTAVNLSPGDQVRDYLYVSDVASALALLATSDLTGPVNICSGVPITVKALAAAAVRGRTALRFGALPYRPHDPWRMVGSPACLRGRGWQPLISLDEGLAATERAMDRERELSGSSV